MAPQTKSTPVYREPMGRHRRASTTSESSSDSGSESGRENKQLLRTWLIQVANQENIPGLTWMNKEKTLLKIPWTHGSRQGFDIQKDSCLFQKWAVHSSEYFDLWLYINLWFCGYAHLMGLWLYTLYGSVVIHNLWLCTSYGSVGIHKSRLCGYTQIYCPVVIHNLWLCGYTQFVMWFAEVVWLCDYLAIHMII